MQMLILDPKTYRYEREKIQHKMKLLGIADSELERLEYELDDYQALVVLKSKKYYGAPEIAPHFAKFNLDPKSIHYMRSINADKHPTWGDLDATIPTEKRIFLYWIRLDFLDEENEPVLEEEMSLVARLRPLVERWEPDFDDKPVNQWGERWESLPHSDWLFATVEKAAKDCQIDLFDDGPKLERLGIDSVHMVKNGNLIVTIFGGANGGGMRGGCNLKHYLCLVRKLLEKLVGCGKPFSDSWLIDWDNDCADDVWTLRLVLKPNDETKRELAECGYEVLKLEESKDELDPNVKFVIDFKKHLGYVDGYFPKHDIADVEMSIARECALRMPTDTAAREVEGDAVILLVLSGDEESVKIGKKLGNCMMKKSEKHDQETLLKLMSDAYKRLTHIDMDKKVKEEISKKKEMMMKHSKEEIVEAIKYWKNELEKLDESFSHGDVDYKKMWKDFEICYKKNPKSLVVGFSIERVGLFGVDNVFKYDDGFGVKLSRSSKNAEMSVNDFFDLILGYGLKSSNISRIDANLEGKGYMLKNYVCAGGMGGPMFNFVFGDEDTKANAFFSEKDNTEDKGEEA